MVSFERDHLEAKIISKKNFAECHAWGANKTGAYKDNLQALFDYFISCNLCHAC
jgi:hypothetical protein